MFEKPWAGQAQIFLTWEKSVTEKNGEERDDRKEQKEKAEKEGKDKKRQGG